MNVGFIGLGTMGLPMARCLLDAGHVVLGWDTSNQARSGFPGAVREPDRMAEECDAFVTMLPEAAQVREVVEALCRRNPPPGRLFVDCSTIDVESTRDLAGYLAEKGHHFTDAPVSGGAEAAAKGALSFMIGGSGKAVAKAGPLLADMGHKQVEFGEAGSGQAAKTCHNMICGITALGVCEAFALADAIGLDPERFYDLCSGAAAQSWILENRCPVPGPSPASPSSNGYRPGFAARLMAKDLGLAQQAAKACGQPTEFGAAAARKFREFADSGCGDLDFSAIYQTFRR
jgi:3-hydroxyisobutyrate dehydrogenase